MLPFPGRGKCERPPVPQTLIGDARLTNTGQRGFVRIRHEDLAIVCHGGRHCGGVAQRVVPVAIEALPSSAGHLRARILGQWECR